VLLKQVVTRAALLKDGVTKDKLRSMSISLALFPTPFKEIYYIPTPEERKATIIDKPRLVLTRSIAAYLGAKDFYYSCRTAEEFWGIRWQPYGDVHIVNTKLSRVVNLMARQERNETMVSRRAQRIAKLLSLYGNTIVFHKVKSIADVRVKHTPYGTYAFKSQIKKDKKRFREKT
jgi:hypothetical protein